MVRDDPVSERVKLPMASSQSVFIQVGPDPKASNMPLMGDLRRACDQLFHMHEDVTLQNRFLPGTPVFC